MLVWEETDGTVKPQVVYIVWSLVGPLILHGEFLPVAQLFLRRMAISPLGITCVLTILVCTPDSQSFPFEAPYVCTLFTHAFTIVLVVFFIHSLCSS